MIFEHKSVLLNECIDALNIKPNGIYVDCTAGGGGHSLKILEKLSGGLLVDIDKDAEALAVCRERLNRGNTKFVQSDFKRLSQVLDELGIESVDGILADLGVSSYQIDNPERGFSYMSKDALLDMRMDASQSLTARDVVNSYDERAIAGILRDYGEEKFAKIIARNIVLERQIAPIETCGQLVDIVDKSIPYAARRNGSHPAKRTFQGLRIEVNKELDGLDVFLREAVDRLKVGGRLAVITFQSLEDRIVKREFTDMATDCICPPYLPICVCNHRAKAVLVNKKPIVPTEEELSANSRSQSAKLRVIEKI
ncbi:MAG: 16S rRNA (cytosine(1402)-N(4))-methyltransferase RsmH [Corallococcus sp.]|nr:16S rRNA (cytosine(1402)-N(4))-methyltransferase RsmH [Corallococcus sp.]